MKVLAAEIRIERMKEEHLILIKDFQSSERELVTFLQGDAIHNQQRRISVTYIWFFEEKLVGYLTLLNDRIHLEGDLKKHFQDNGIHYNSLPALKIGRLCVDERYTRRGIGTLMIAFAVEKADKIFLEIAGCKFITLEAKRDSLQFYQMCGFASLRHAKHYIQLYLTV